MTKTSETYISFYLRANRIHVFIDSLRGLGSPKRVCFLMDDNGNTLVLIPYGKRDLVSHKVPEEAYIGSKDMEISSKKLKHWDNSPYNPGKTLIFQWIRIVKSNQYGLKAARRAPQFSKR